MKGLLILIFLVLVFSACDKNNNCMSSPMGISEICVDSSLINDSIVCYEIYSPVCGCDGITYPNDCYADRLGVISYVTGEFYY